MARLEDAETRDAAPGSEILIPVQFRSDGRPGFEPNSLQATFLVRKSMRATLLAQLLLEVTRESEMNGSKERGEHPEEAPICRESGETNGADGANRRERKVNYGGEVRGPLQYPRKWWWRRGFHGERVLLWERGQRRRWGRGEHAASHWMDTRFKSSDWL
ncbi:hypothetical protein AAFF_G00049570 [Aldrovandia affinis]|uniref:Uncharacterized protein n=1 Tax=Aldrovandia affinis TaxID=143900 RepID=A0AAD7WEL2_9TELE|nr:hypothetical protein AAFF_G00049570 [Aldrovandia affinis]